MRQRVVSRDEWTTARVALLAQEKELARRNVCDAHANDSVPIGRVGKLEPETDRRRRKQRHVT